MILVTGGTGFVGQEIVKQILAIPLPVRLLVRSGTFEQLKAEYGEEGIKTLGFEIAIGDVLEPETLSSAMAGVTIVIHLVGILLEEQISYEQAHIHATKNMVEAAKRAGVQRFIHMSALGTRPQAVSRYHQTKWDAEELVRQSGLAWTIFRPSLIYGYDDRDRILKMISKLLTTPLNIFYLRSFALIGGGRNKIQPVSLTEVSYAFAQAVQHPEMIGKTYDLTGATTLTFKEFVVKIAEAERVKVIIKDAWLNLIIRGALWVSVIGLMFFIFLSPPIPHWLAATDWYRIAIGKGGQFFVAGTWGVIILIWLGLTLIALRWKSVIIFGVPVGLSRWIAQRLGYGQIIDLILEDNVGDGAPLSHTLGYRPQTMEEGLKNYFN